MASHYSTDQPAAVASFRTWRIWQGSGLNDLPLQKYNYFGSIQYPNQLFRNRCHSCLKLKPDKKEFLALLAGTLGFQHLNLLKRFL
jgi:hypothetical protein